MSTTSKPRFRMDLTTMPRQTANTPPLTNTGTVFAVATLEGGPLSFAEERCVLHVSPNAAVGASKPERPSPPAGEH